MTESQKTAISTTENHDITFPTGENLSATKNKQGVTLNLRLDESNKNTYSEADQTPTPTRFIRNCEEVGLFQDLQNVNPFDETFKKAAELAKSGTLHIPEASTDDTLHTPHILPHEENVGNFKQNNNEIFSISRVSSLDEDLLKLGANKEVVGGEILDKLCDSNKVGNESLDSTFSISRVPSIDEDLLIIANDDSDSDKDATASDSNKNKENKETSHTDTNKALKMRLKEAVQNRLKGDNRTLKLLDSGQGIIIAPVDIQKIKNAESATLLISQKPDPSLVKAPRKRVVKQPSEPTKRQKTVEEESSSSEKEKVRAMNRAAQSRSRIRKKHWINEMVKTVDDLTVENKHLKMLNEQLRKEISLVRSILHFHNDCSAAKDPEIKNKIDQLFSAVKQKAAPPKNKGHIPIRPAPSSQTSGTPLKIELPVVAAVPSNVQVCVVPTLNSRQVLQVAAVALNSEVAKSVVQMPK